MCVGRRIAKQGGIRQGCFQVEIMLSPDRLWSDVEYAVEMLGYETADRRAFKTGSILSRRAGE